MHVGETGPCGVTKTSVSITLDEVLKTEKVSTLGLHQLPWYVLLFFTDGVTYVSLKPPSCILSFSNPVYYIHTNYFVVPYDPFTLNQRSCKRYLLFQVECFSP